MAHFCTLLYVLMFSHKRGNTECIWGILHLEFLAKIAAQSCCDLSLVAMNLHPLRANWIFKNKRQLTLNLSEVGHKSGKCHISKLRLWCGGQSNWVAAASWKQKPVLPRGLLRRTESIDVTCKWGQPVNRSLLLPCLITILIYLLTDERDPSRLRSLVLQALFSLFKCKIRLELQSCFFLACVNRGMVYRSPSTRATADSLTLQKTIDR